MNSERKTTRLIHNDSSNSSIALTIKVNGSRSISIDLSDDTIKFPVRQFVIQRGQNFFESGGGDVAVALPVVEPEGLLQLLRGGLVVVLLEEVGGDVAEAVEVDLAAPVRVVLRDQVVELGVVEELAHGVQDGLDLDGLDETRLASVEHLECFAHDCHLLVFIGLLQKMVS